MKPKFAWRTVRKMLKENGLRGTGARLFAWKWGYHIDSGTPHGRPHTLRAEQRAAAYGTEIRGATRSGGGSTARTALDEATAAIRRGDEAGARAALRRARAAVGAGAPGRTLTTKQAAARLRAAEIL
jgi:hypothetical protein